MFLLTPGGTALSLPVTSYIHVRSAGDLGAVLGASASIRGYIQQKQLDFQCVFYCFPVILLQMRGVWGALLSVRACALALWGHVSQ